MKAQSQSVEGRAADDIVDKAKTAIAELNGLAALANRNPRRVVMVHRAIKAWASQSPRAAKIAEGFLQELELLK